SVHPPASRRGGAALCGATYPYRVTADHSKDDSRFPDKMVDQKEVRASSRVREIWKRVSSFVSSKSVLRSSFRFARRSSPPCSRIFFERLTRTPRPDESMYPVCEKSIRN